jgi:hypothetical protein
MKLRGMNIAFIIVFGMIGLTQFTENVRTVQVLGLFASGAVVGAALYGLLATRRAKPRAE